MAQTIETIDGHRYLVTRDDTGKIVGMEGRDTFTLPPPTSRPPEVTALLGKDPQTFTLKDLAILLQHLAKRQ